MCKKIFSRLTLILSCLLLFNSLKAQYPSDSVQVYLLTASPGEETYAAFGHSAIRVADPIHGMDVVYNYGTFDFSTPHFYWKFSTGRLMYSLSVQSYERFLRAYYSWGQAIYQQKFLLTNKEKWQLVNNLQINYQPENRYYRYDFFRDNCATRIRDIIQKSVDGKVLYDSTYVVENQSFRELIAHYLNRQPWAFFGINILLGKGTDSIATLTDYMFLPEHMKNLYERTNIVRGDTIGPITEKAIELFPTTLSFPKPNPLTSPVAVFVFVFVAIAFLTWLDFKKKIYLRWLDAILFLITGLLGALILFLMTASLHKVLAYNYNIVWANPVNLFILFWIFTKSLPAWLRKVLVVYAVLLALFIPVSFFIWQNIPDAASPIIAIIILRLIRIIKR